MAINKVVNRSTKSSAAMRNVIEYVCRDEKVKEGYAYIAGPYPGETINYDEIYRCWMQEKEIWNKNSGRMYAHNIISFHKDEAITPAEVLEIGKSFAERFFPEHQYVVTVHQDKQHLHCHIVTNSVSYIDGMKLHQTKKDLEKQKDFTNNLLLERGMTIAEKGKHFDGTPIEQGEVIAWNENKYNLLLNDSKKSYVADCALALMEVIPESANKEEFISGMKKHGWNVRWEDNRKHITFQNENGDKVRDSNIEKTVADMHVNKEALIHEFERQNEIRAARLREERKREEELKRYHEQLEHIGEGYSAGESVSGNQETDRTERQTVVRRPVRGSGDDTDSFIADIRTEINNNRVKNRTVVNTENQSIADEGKRRLEEQQRSIEQ